LLLSAASAWEIAIKYGLGKLQLPEPPEEYIPRLMVRTGITSFPYTTVTPPRRESPAHHRDPFAHAHRAGAIGDVPILNADRTFRRYKVEIIPASQLASRG